MDSNMKHDIAAWRAFSRGAKTLSRNLDGTIEYVPVFNPDTLKIDITCRPLSEQGKLCISKIFGTREA